MKFYDTCSLLKKVDNLFDEGYFVISSITLNELENIKTSTTKDPDIKYAARKLLHTLDENQDKYEVFIYYNNILDNFKSYDITNDIKILSSAYEYKLTKNKDLIFVTNDLALKIIAKTVFDNVISVGENFDDDYCGYIEMIASDEILSNFYSNPTNNIFNLLINQYVIIKNKENELVGCYCWNGKEYRHISYGTFKSKWFGDVKPVKGDYYQALAADSLINNKITLIKGPAGSGKTYLSLGYLLYLLDKGRIGKIIIFCNTVATKNSAKLGYLPGTKNEKLLDSQIGNLLISKIGGREEVERMIYDGDLVLLPMSDIRGYDTNGMQAGIYISEAQNLDIELMKLALQRIGDDSICIIDGDEKTQVDDIHFAGANNGMRRVSKVFKGENIYGEVKLKIIHRSKIAQIAERM